MTESSASLLESLYSANTESITVIPHGVPIFKKLSQSELKRKYDCEGRQIITPFGLIGPGKGLDAGIKAIAEVFRQPPLRTIFDFGKTHPNLIASEGETYRIC